MKQVRTKVKGTTMKTTTKTVVMAVAMLVVAAATNQEAEVATMIRTPLPKAPPSQQLLQQPQPPRRRTLAKWTRRGGTQAHQPHARLMQSATTSSFVNLDKEKMKHQPTRQTELAKTARTERRSKMDMKECNVWMSKFATHRNSSIRTHST
jgi:ribosomal protein L2